MYTQINPTRGKVAIYHTLQVCIVDLYSPSGPFLALCVQCNIEKLGDKAYALPLCILCGAHTLMWTMHNNTHISHVHMYYYDCLRLSLQHSLMSVLIKQLNCTKTPQTPPFIY